LARLLKGAKDMFCPYSDRGNKKRKTRKVMEEHLCKFGFMPNYIRWVYHGEAHRIREDVVRPLLEAFDGDVGVAYMIDDFHQGHFAKRPTKEEEVVVEEEPEPTIKAFYDMLSSTQKLLHEKATISQLDAIGSLMRLKSQYNMSQACFDDMLVVIGGFFQRAAFYQRICTSHTDSL